MKTSLTTRLAYKYIRQNKRHSVLTVLSITAAVILVTVILTVLSSIYATMRNTALEYPYHIKLWNTTAEQTEQISKLEYVESVKNVREDKKNCTLIMFNHNNSDPVEQLAKDCKKIAPNNRLAKGEDAEDGDLYDMNAKLLTLDMMTVDGRGIMANFIAGILLGILVILGCARFIIDTSFEISSKEREVQFGILKTIGASPKQIRMLIAKEGLILSVAGIPLGLIFGTLAAYIIYRLGISQLLKGFSKLVESDSYDIMKRCAEFSVNPVFIAACIVISIIWVFFSAYGTGSRVSKKSPLEAVHGSSKTVKKISKARIAKKLFGTVGVLSSRNVKREKKRFVITVLSVSLSIALFSMSVAASSLFTDMLKTDYSMDDTDFDMYIIPEENPDIALKGTDIKTRIKQIEDSGMFSKVENYMTYGYLEMEEGHKLQYRSKEKVIKSPQLQLNTVSEEDFNKCLKPFMKISYEEWAKKGGITIASQIDDLKLSGYKLNQPTKLSSTIDLFTDNGQEYPQNIKIETDEEGNKFIRSNYKVKITDEVKINTEEIDKNEDMKEFYSLLLNDDPNISPDPLAFVAAENYFDVFGEDNFFSSPNIGVNLKDDVTMKEAVNFINKNNWSYDDNGYSAKVKVQTLMSVTELGIKALTSLVAVIAAVNLINIISTGIINRRKEFHTMYCVGMDNKQMNKMLVLENLKYILSALVLGLIISVFIVTNSENMLIGLENVGDNTITSGGITVKNLLLTIPSSLAAALTALLIGLVTAFIAIRRVRKNMSEQNAN